LTEQTRPTGPRFIIGERITLRSIERDDLPHVRRWLDDPELRRQIGARSPLSEAESVEWFERISADPARAWYVIVVDEDERVVGEAGLLRMDPEWRTTDMTVIVGERDERGKGYGTEAGRLLLDLAFNYLGLHRVAIGVVGFNEGALGFWKKLGFRQEGVQRDGYLHGDGFHDFVMMSILEDEWRALQAAAAARGQAPAGERVQGGEE
jgi:RimJ/RimL family protein N-acetyltransferase